MNDAAVEKRTPVQAKRRSAGIAATVAPLLAASLFAAALICSRAPGETGDSSPWGRAIPDTVLMIGPEVVQVLNDVALLDVYEMNVSQTIVRNLEDRFLDVRIGDAVINAEYSFMVSAGIDLSRVSAGDVDVDFPGGSTRVTATLPWPGITGVYCLNRSYSVSESFIFRGSNDIIAASLAQMDIEADNLVRQRALGMGLVDRAAESGRLEVEALLKSLGADVAVVRYR